MTRGTYITCWPSQINQIIQASVFIREHMKKVTNSIWILLIHSTNSLDRGFYAKYTTGGTKSIPHIVFYTSEEDFDKQPLDPDNWHVIKEDGVGVFYPKQWEDRPDEEGVLSNEVLDTANEKFARSLHPFLVNVRQVLLSKDWSQPPDLAISYDGNYVYLACVNPAGTIEIDMTLAIQLKETVNDYFQSLKFSEGSSIINVGMPETVEGVLWFPIELRYDRECSIAVFGYEPERIYAAYQPFEDLDEISEEDLEECYKTLRQQLIQKVRDSKQAAIEKQKPPQTVFHSHWDDYQYRLDYEPFEDGSRFTGYIGRDNSFWNLIGLVKALNNGVYAPYYFLPPPQFRAECVFGDDVLQDEVAEMVWLRTAAEQGDAEAQYWLATCYYMGDGVPADVVDTVEWYRKSAEQGFALAQCALGAQYLKGEGVPMDEEEGMRWVRKAVEQGNAEGQHFLGWCYYQGLGVPQDTTEAIKWLRQAEAQGMSGATALLQQIEKETSTDFTD